MLRRFSLFLLFSLLITGLHAQPSPGTNTTDGRGRKQGSWSKSYPNGQIRYQGQFKDDLPVGEFRHYDEEGVLTTIQEYATDGQSSTARHLHSNGTTMAEGRYAGQEKDGLWKYYDQDGTLRRSETFSAGELDGERTTYYRNGSVAEKDNFTKGVLNGPSKSWFENGFPSSESTYVNGEAEGKMIHYYPSGKKEYEGTVKNDQRHGTWFHFNPDGSVHVRLTYSKGELTGETRENGTFRELYGDEQPKSEITYKKGKREGPYIEYHQNGEWLIKQVPADPVSGARPDVERELKGQTKRLEGTYKNDLLEGDVKEYDEKGRLLKVTKYEGGVVVGEEVKR